jgi:predicted phosphodiesterase
VRVAGLFDVHANLPALEAVLAEPDVAAAEVIVVGGDVAAGPLPAETLDRLAALGERVRFVRGNADREVIDAHERWIAGAIGDQEEGPRPGEGELWVAQRLGSSHRELLASFKPSISLRVAALGEVLFCHASPRSDEEMITEATPEARLREALGGCEAQVIIAGHTHVQFDRQIGERRFINAGSVGMPYEDEPGAYWVLLGPDVQLRRTAYDYQAAAGAIRASGYTDAEELLRESLFAPVGRSEATAFFEELGTRRARVRSG